MYTFAFTTPPPRPDTYPQLLAAVQARFAQAVAGGEPLFTTDAAGLYGLYLATLPDDAHRHDCRTCQRFFELYGGLVTVGPDGTRASALWDPEIVPPFYRATVGYLAGAVGRATITGVLVADRPILGVAASGGFTHFAVGLPPALIHTRRVPTAEQRAAELLEDYRTLQRALAAFTLPVVDQAVRLLESEHLARGEKVLGPARWLQALIQAREGQRDPRRREALTWRAVASAPAGYTHPKSTMIGTLLDDIAAGLPFEAVRRRFAEKMDPLQYLRPQAAPAAGTIAAAERLVAELGVARSLERRYARLDELVTTWQPQAPTAAPAVGVFAHLQPQPARPALATMRLPAITLTWVKFCQTVLPSALRLELRVPGGMAAYVAFVTAAHADAPPILQWDSREQRNPVSWYNYHGGSPADNWGLVPGAWHPVAAIVPAPPHWYGSAAPNQAEMAALILPGAKDQNAAHVGLALFPEILKTELHAIRSVIEAHSKAGRMQGVAEASACGLGLGQGRIGVTVRVTTAAGQQEYLIDRWA